MIALVYIGLVMAVECPGYYKENIDKPSVNGSPATEIKWAYLDWNIFTTCCTILHSVGFIRRKTFSLLVCLEHDENEIANNHRGNHHLKEKREDNKGD